MNIKLFTFILSGIFLACSCEDETIESSSNGKYSKGVLVVNEGNFNKENAEISFISPDSSKVYNDIYYAANHQALGDVAQSAAASGDHYFIVVNNSNKIEVVNQADFKTIKTITGLKSPRYIAFQGGKGYITQWGTNGLEGSVAVLNLSSYSIEKTIAAGSGAEKMLFIGDHLYVSNSGGFGSDSTLTVIDTKTGSVINTIKVGYNPKSMVADKNNKIWILCGGKWKNDYSGLEKPGSLVCLNPGNDHIERSFTFNSDFSQPSSLCLNVQKDKLIYQYDNKIYEMSVTDQQLPVTARINRGFYNMAVDPASGIIYASDPKTYIASGYVIRFSAAYNLLDSFKVGNVPGELYFNN